MKFIYPAVFRKNESGGYDAYFPDLECCEASGDTLDDIETEAGDIVRNISVNIRFYEGWDE